MSEYSFIIAIPSVDPVQITFFKKKFKQKSPYLKLNTAHQMKSDAGILFFFWDVSLSDEIDEAESAISHLFKGILKDGAEELYGLYKDEHDESDIGKILYIDKKININPEKWSLNEHVIFTGEQDSDLFDCFKDDLFNNFYKIIELHKSNKLKPEVFPNDSSVDINKPVNEEGYTQLMYAVTDYDYDKDDVIELLAKGSDPNIQNNLGFTALMYACASCNKDYILPLLQKGADPNIINNFSMTALMFSTREHDQNTAKLLIEYGADVNAVTKLNETALFFVLPVPAHAKINIPKNIEIVKTLLESGADINHKDATNSTPLNHAAALDNADMVDFLISQGADINHKNNLGETSLSLAIRENSANVLKILNKMKIS